MEEKDGLNSSEISKEENGKVGIWIGVSSILGFLETPIGFISPLEGTNGPLSRARESNKFGGEFVAAWEIGEGGPPWGTNGSF